MHQVQTVTTGKWKEHCHIVYSDQGERDALVVDPGEDPTEILEFISKSQLRPRAIMNTHAHFDHVGSVSTLKEQFKIPFYLHSGDFKLLTYANLYRKLFDGLRNIKIPTVDMDFSVFPEVTLGALTAKALHTPGHTPGSVCILIDGKLFTGDLVLFGKIGRTDLPGGNHPALLKSIESLRSLPSNTLVYPGHGKVCSLEQIFKDLDAHPAEQELKT